MKEMDGHVFEEYWRARYLSLGHTEEERRRRQDAIEKGELSPLYHDPSVDEEMFKAFDMVEFHRACSDAIERGYKANRITYYFNHWLGMTDKEKAPYYDRTDIPKSWVEYTAMVHATIDVITFSPKENESPSDE
jgi:hypothetical protein